MSYIVSEVYDAFRELGLNEDKAKAAAAAIPGQEHVATTSAVAALKGDIADLKADIARDFQSLYRQLWLMGIGIIVAVGVLTRLP